MAKDDLDRRERLRRALQHTPGPGPAFPCSYLPDRQARHQTLLAADLPPGLYHDLMDLNFRRLGDLVYRPVCDACSACRQLRVPVRSFAPSRAQRRCLARNADVVAATAEPVLTDEKADLYRRYLAGRHDGQMDGSPDELERFLYAGTARTVETCYRLAGRLVAVGIADLEPRALSAVYCYFDPDLPGRGLGVLNVLALIGEARARDLPWVYLGYFVAGSRTMAYKAGYRPCEALTPEGAWEPPARG
ncbi:MAG: arginyltransferase [Vicinamibacteria bacterium]